MVYSSGQRRLLTNDSIGLGLLCLLSIFGYFYLLGASPVWRADEALYADAVREMLFSGHYLEIFFNAEPRYNKPPLTYWLMAASALIFGISEWAFRLPIVLTGIGSVWVTYRLGKILANQKTGIIAAIVMAFSFQFVIHTRVSIPTVPLTYFFTLTVLWFVEAYQLQNRTRLLGAYVALGLTVLTKGFPYLIIIPFIAGWYVFMLKDYKWKEWVKTLRWAIPWYGPLISMIIGMSWIAYMWITAGDAFYQVFMDETIRRAFVSDKPLFRPKDLYFYLDAISWGFAPYSLLFFFAFSYILFKGFRPIRGVPVLQLSTAWFLVMYVVFTISRGKIPTYIIQAHPALALLTSYFMVQGFSSSQWLSRSWQGLFALTSVVLHMGLGVMLVAFSLSWPFYLLSLLPVVIYGANYWLKSYYLSLLFLPYQTLVIAFLIFLGGVLPQMDAEVRQYPVLAQVIKEHSGSDPEAIVMEDRLFHNLPYYVARKVHGPLETECVLDFRTDETIFVIAPRERLAGYQNPEIIWSGYFYSRYGEARVLEFMIDFLKLRQGQPSRIKEYVLFKRSPIQSHQVVKEATF